MAAAPRWKVFRGDEYVAACKYVEDAAVLVSAFGEGSTIRSDHAKSAIVWAEGKESQPAGESYDHVAIVVEGRMAERRRKFAAEREVRETGWRKFDAEREEKA